MNTKTIENSQSPNIIQNLTAAKKLTLCALFTALIAVGAFIHIPIPILPFTLQTMFTLLAGSLLGAKLGSMSVLVYIALGLMGFPVFAQGGGIAYVLKPSFGYIIGFFFATYVTGTISHKVNNPSYKRILGGNLLGLLIIYSVGMVYYYIMSNYVIGGGIGLMSLFIYCCLIFIPSDVIQCILGALLTKRLLPIIKKR